MSCNGDPIECGWEAALGQAEETIRRVRDLHSHGRGTDTCNGCGEGWPCTTTEALDGQK